MANNPVPKPAVTVTPPTTPVKVAPPIPVAIAIPPLINAGTATIDNPIAVITLLSEATPPIVNPIPTNAVKPRIHARIGKLPSPSEYITGLLLQYINRFIPDGVSMFK